jgi:nucleoside-diphosphate-sugar epimerase
LVYGADATANFRRLTKRVKKLPALPFALVNNKRSFISVDNLADFLVKCITHPKAAGETFMIDDGQAVSIKHFTNAIAKGKGTVLWQLPMPVGLMTLAAKLLGQSGLAQQLLGDLAVDSSKAKTLLGWKPLETMEQAMAKLK